MDDFYRLPEQVPGYLQDILQWDLIPWNHVKDRHGDSPDEPLISLLDAYRQLGELVDLWSLSSRTIGEYEGTCTRCGSCCAHRRPGSVSSSTYRRWLEMELPVAMFYNQDDGADPGSSFSCWFHKGIRLRICPFLLVNLVDGKPFCAIHHTGNENRPPACSEFLPHPPTCQTTSLPLVI
ncbi:MAG: hypothetical protein P1S46_05035 [bacterium]|nr:hypothetical protein [bacterium]MDT8284457.1 hypothetical protein [Thermovirgaceae bacterium]